VTIATSDAVKFVDLGVQSQALEPELRAAIAGVIERGDFILGGAVEEFEGEFATYCGVDHCVGVDSGLSALEMALRGAGIGPGDEVITQTNTFIATVGSILTVGATPVLVDCDARGGIDPDQVAAAITERTRAIVPVHLFGRIGEIDAVCALADRHGVSVIEDAAQAHGALLHGRRAGSFGIAAAFSFYPAKNLGAFGDGGAFVTRSAEIASRARTIRNYGQRVKYEHVDLPLNRRLDTLQAAVLRVKLPHLDAWNASRERIADAYREHLEGVPVVVPGADPPGRHVYHLFVVQTDDRDALQRTLAQENIQTGIHYPLPCHLQVSLSHLDYARGQFPNAERLAQTSLSLPMYPELSTAHVERVAGVVRRHFAG
jgi:dTDP-4-amino-4,6-dideoxygalactose transaminase